MRIAVVGLGYIGLGVSRLLLAAGMEVVGYDVRIPPPDQMPAGLKVATSPASAVEGADCALIAVFDDAQLDAVLTGKDGITSAESPAPVIAILSTVTPESVRNAHAVGASIGAEVLDCGVSGGRGLAREEKLALSVGGAAAAVEQIRPALESFGDPVVYMGPLGTGMAGKIARNLLYFCTALVDWEAARLAAEAGVDVERFIDFVTGAETKVSGHMAHVTPQGADGRPGPPANLVRFAGKDLGAALELAGELGIELPVAALARLQFRALE